MSDAGKRKVYTAAFKTRVGLEALSEKRTLNEIARSHGVHPVQVSQWKREIVEGVPALFETWRGPKKPEESTDPERLYVVHATGAGGRRIDRRSLRPPALRCATGRAGFAVYRSQPGSRHLDLNKDTFCLDFGGHHSFWGWKSALDEWLNGRALDNQFN